MGRAKRNPIGRLFADTIPVVIGNRTLVHIYHPKDQIHICLSGKNAGRPPTSGKDRRGEKEFEYYRSNAKYITCWRCIKLGVLNESEGRRAWDRGKRGR